MRNARAPVPIVTKIGQGDGVPFPATSTQTQTTQQTSDGTSAVTSASRRWRA
jgi:hypothetical protein